MILTQENVDSSVIQKLHWIQSAEHLVVVFNSGSIWIYKSVSYNEYQDLLEAESVGSHFNKNIRDIKPSMLLYKKEN